MRSIERRFRQIEKENPFLSTLLCFNRAVGGQGFSKDRIARLFNKLVDPDDYHGDAALKKELLSHHYANAKPTKKKKAASDKPEPSKKGAEAYEKQAVRGSRTLRK